jgi:hypothetical protein
MSRSEQVPDKVATEKVSKNRRSEARHSCRVRTLFSSQAGAEPQLDTRWSIGKIADVSKRGIALLVPRTYELGTILFVEPLVQPWNATRELEARVANVRPESGGWWCLGCELKRPLDPNELQALLETVA